MVYNNTSEGIYWSGNVRELISSGGTVYGNPTDLYNNSGEGGPIATFTNLALGSTTAIYPTSTGTMDATTASHSVGSENWWQIASSGAEIVFVNTN